MSPKKRKLARKKGIAEKWWMIIVLAGFLVIAGSLGAGLIFGTRQPLVLTEGETASLVFGPGDSLYLHKFRLTFYPESQSIKDYQALVASQINGVLRLDTVSLNHPLKRGFKRIYLVDYGLSKDSVYLRFVLRTPWLDTIPYEFPPAGVINDERFPMIISFENFRIDRSQLWPLPEVPEVKVKIIEPGKLIAEKKMRAPDSLSFNDYILYFDGIRFRPTATFVCVHDVGIIAALAGAAIILAGFIFGFLIRAKKKFGSVDV